MKLTRNELEKILANLIKRDYLIFAEEQIETEELLECQGFDLDTNIYNVSDEAYFSKNDTFNDIECIFDIDLDADIDAETDKYLGNLETVITFKDLVDVVEKAIADKSNS